MATNRKEAAIAEYLVTLFFQRSPSEFLTETNKFCFGGSSTSGIGIPLSCDSYIYCYCLNGSFKKNNPKAPNPSPRAPMKLKHDLHPMAAIIITLNDDNPLPR